MHTSNATNLVTYVLRLSNDRWYVGKTEDLDRRYEQHCSGSGAKWTKLYPPVEVFSTYPGDRENEITDELILKHGYGFVRGGDYCQISDLNPRQAKRRIKRMLARNNSQFSDQQLQHLNRMFGVLGDPETLAEEKMRLRKERKQAQKEKVSQQLEKQLRKRIESELRPIIRAELIKEFNLNF